MTLGHGCAKGKVNRASKIHYVQMYVTLKIKHQPFLKSPLVAGHSDNIREPEMDAIFSTKVEMKVCAFLVRIKVLMAVRFMIIALKNLISCCVVDM